MRDHLSALDPLPLTLGLLVKANEPSLEQQAAELRAKALRDFMGNNSPEIRESDCRQPRVALDSAGYPNIGFGYREVTMVEVEAAVAQPKADGWIEWAGGNSPVAADVRVEARLFNGAIVECFAGRFFWGRDDADPETDIAAYRIVG